jgi:hypothetical protein
MKSEIETKDQVTTVMSYLDGLGRKVSRGQAQELIAQLQQCKSWNVLKGILKKWREPGSAQNSEVAAPARKFGSVLNVIDVMMSDVVGDYDDASDVPEWHWVQQHASFSHKDNGAGHGIWEFLVNVQCASLEDGNDSPIPEKLKPVLEEALALNAGWVLFYNC